MFRSNCSHTHNAGVEQTERAGTADKGRAG